MTKKERLESRGDKWCVHRTPFSDEYKTCKADVNFHEFPKPHDEMPCLGETPEAIARCPKYLAKTPEQLAAREKEIEDSMKRFVVCRAAIVEAVKATGKAQDVIPCPWCKSGRLGYSQSSYNGHIHARCSTPNCANWME